MNENINNKFAQHTMKKHLTIDKHNADNYECMPVDLW